MNIADFKNKKILIVGRGIEGEASEKYLKKKFPGMVIDVVDKKDGQNYLEKQKNYDIAIKSPSVKPKAIKIPYTTETNIFLTNAKGKIIGVTGTKGKSTTATLIYEMLKKQGFDAYLGGNIGVPPLDFLDKLNAQSKVVLELSSFQLQDLKVSPHIAVLLMIVPEHLDYHQSLGKYIDAKRNILRFQTAEDFAIINKDYPASNESDVQTPAQIFKVSREGEDSNGCFVRGKSVWIRKDGEELEIVKLSEIKLIGKHNLENVCAATMAAYLAGVLAANITAVLKTFSGLEHRLEFVRTIGNVNFFNDSLATLPQATVEALKTLKETETLIAGGFDRGLDYKDLAKAIVQSGIKTLILFPTTGARIWKEICEETNNPPEKFDVTTMEQAVRIAFAETTPGKICLMSPASASFNLFKDYKDRGNQFKEQVASLQS
jgi:UDP-N-acetylmuramoylalanine--D-glutamate ligase